MEKSLEGLASQIADVEIKRVVDLIQKLISINNEQSKVVKSLEEAKKSFDEVSEQIKYLSTGYGNSTKKDVLVNFSKVITKVKEDIDGAIINCNDNDTLKKLADFIGYYYQSNYEVEMGAADEEERVKKQNGL